MERGSDLRTFFNTKILEIIPETDHVLLENLSSCTFIQLPLQNFEYNSKPQSQKIPSESIPQSQKFSSKRIPQSQNFQAKNYPKLAHIPVSPIVKYPPPPPGPIPMKVVVESYLWDIGRQGKSDPGTKKEKHNCCRSNNYCFCQSLAYSTGFRLISVKFCQQIQIIVD